MRDCNVYYIATMKKTFTLFFTILLFALPIWSEETTDAGDLIRSTRDKNTIKGLLEDEALNIQADNIFTDLYPGQSAPSGNDTTIIVVDQATHGHTPSPQKGANTIEYIPANDYYQFGVSSPVDSFSFCYDFGTTPPTYSDTIWVYIDSIIGVNDVPVANIDTFEISQDSGAIYAQALMNDVDKDLAGLEVIKLTDPVHGTISFGINDYYFDSKHLFFPHEGITHLNSNLLLPYDQRDTTYLNDTVFVFQPESDYYGYDSMQYIVREFRYSDIPFFQENYYEFIHTEDADTATIYFYIQPHDYIPVATNDTVYRLPDNSIMKESDIRVEKNFLPMANDLDADTIPAFPNIQLELPYIIKNKADSATATSDNDTVVFYHDIPYFDASTQSLALKKDSNIAILQITGDVVSYNYAAGFSGVDSLFYKVVERPLFNSVYPAEFRGDTSDFGIIYFVVEPVNDVTIPFNDTLEFDLDNIEDPSTKLWQHFDILANDIDIDEVNDGTLDALKRLMGNDYKEAIASYGKAHVKTSTGAYGKGIFSNDFDNTKNNFTLEMGDSVYYLFTPPYDKKEIIDSIGYLIYDGHTDPDTMGWAYIKNTPPIANNDIFSVGDFKINEADSTIANNFALTLNDMDPDTLIVLFDNTDLKALNQSSYAVIKDAGSNNIDYFYHQGFTTKDSFQYIVSDLLTYDTAWVFINNSPISAVTDSIKLTENPFLEETDPFVTIDALSNDTDSEDLLHILSFNHGKDSLESRNAHITLELDSTDYQTFNYVPRDSFFYIDSFKYIVTDVPVFFAADNFFTKDSAWVIIVDSAMVIDSDGDGLVNTYEDGIEGYQAGEDTIGIGQNGIPNYLNWDADGDGFPDGGDCDGDGIPNLFDPDDCDGASLDVSTAFTPNGDGVNDLFIIPDLVLSNGDVLPASIKIYNRWGSLVYENEAYGQNGDWWDGKLGDVQGLNVGKDLPNGVYLYYLNFSGYEKEGFIHIQK